MNDDYSRVNPILRRIMAEIYRKRTPLPKENLTNVRMERVRDQAFCECSATRFLRKADRINEKK